MLQAPQAWHCLVVYIHIVHLAPLNINVDIVDTLDPACRTRNSFGAHWYECWTCCGMCKIPVNQLSLKPSTVVDLSIPSTRHPHVPPNNANVVRSFPLLRSNVASIASLRCGEAKPSRPCLVTKVYLRSVIMRAASESADG